MNDWSSCHHPFGCQAPGEGCAGPCPVSDTEAAQIEGDYLRATDQGVMTENPAGTFIAHFLAESTHGADWADLSEKRQTQWRRLAGELVGAMYKAGFTIPQPTDPEAVWANLRRPGMTAPDEPCVCGTEFGHDCLATLADEIENLGHSFGIAAAGDSARNDLESFAFNESVSNTLRGFADRLRAALDPA